MARPRPVADDKRVTLRVVVSLLAGAVVAAAFVGPSGTATAGALGNLKPRSG